MNEYQSADRGNNCCSRSGMQTGFGKDPETREWIEELWDDEVGDCRQEIVFIGVEMDREQIEAKLDAALLSDTEMAAGPEHWRRFEDPLPSWEQPQLETA